MEKREDFLMREESTKDTIDFKTMYVDMCWDLIWWLLLSQIVYRNLNDKKWKTKLRVKKKDWLRLAKRDKEWYNEIRITERQARRARKVLENCGLIQTKIYKFNWTPTVHIRLEPIRFLSKMEITLKSNRNDSNVKSITESTTQNTTKTNINTSQSKIDDAVFSLLLEHNGALSVLVDEKGLTHSQAVTELFSRNWDYPKNCAHVNELVWYLYDFYDMHDIEPNFRFWTVNFFDKLQKEWVLDYFIEHVWEEIDIDLWMESIKDEVYRTREDFIHTLKYYGDTY